MSFFRRMMVPPPTGSVFFDGTGDYLTVASSANLSVGTGDFTAEMFLRPDTGAPNAALLDFRPSGDGSAPFFVLSYLGASGMDFTHGGISRISGGVAAVETWHHLAIARSGTSLRMFLNGAQVGSTYSSSDNFQAPANRPVIGASGLSLGTSAFKGRISNLRVVKGTALYTAGFTPPRGELTPVSGTQLLTCLGDAFADRSVNAYAITAAGNAALSPLAPF